MMGLSTTVSISFAIALVAGKNRVPIPATGNTAFLIFIYSPFFLKALISRFHFPGDRNFAPNVSISRLILVAEFSHTKTSSV
jgi:hypothetical protein